MRASQRRSGGEGEEGDLYRNFSKEESKSQQENGKIFDIINEGNVKSHNKISPPNHLSGQYPKINQPNRSGNRKP